MPDFAHFRKIALAAREKGLLSAAATPQAAAPPEAEVSVSEWANFDFGILNIVFGLRLNATMSPLRMIRTVHLKWMDMKPEERDAIPPVVREMVAGLRSCSSNFLMEGRIKQPVPIVVEYVSESVALIRSSSPERFTDLVLNLEHSPGWRVYRSLSTGCQFNAESILLQGPLVAAVKSGDQSGKRLRDMLESIQQYTTDMENLSSALM